MPPHLTTKSLSERVAARMLEKPSRNAKNKALFLALREEIQQALNDGWSVKSIWETLHEEGKISFSYQAFCGHVNRSILSPATTDIANGNSQTSKPVVNKSGKTIKPAGFTYNPTANKDDLF